MSYYRNSLTPPQSPFERAGYSTTMHSEPGYFPVGVSERGDRNSTMSNDEPFSVISEPFAPTSQFRTTSPDIGDHRGYYPKYGSVNETSPSVDSYSQEYAPRCASESHHYPVYDSYTDSASEHYAYTDPVQGNFYYGNDPLYQSTVSNRYAYSPNPRYFHHSPTPGNFHPGNSYVYEDTYSASTTSEDAYGPMPFKRAPGVSRHSPMGEYNSLNSIFDTEPQALQPNEQYENTYKNNLSLEIDLNKVRSGEDTRTTLMIKNIPNSFTQTLMIRIINNYMYNKYNFFYLPIDYNTHCNYGYAYINLLSPKYVEDFINNFNNMRWPKTPSKKICKITYAKIQGMVHMRSKAKEAMIMQLPPEFRPLFFVQTKTYYHDKAYTSLKAVSITEFFNSNPTIGLSGNRSKSNSPIPGSMNGRKLNMNPVGIPTMPAAYSSEQINEPDVLPTKESAPQQDRPSGDLHANL